MRLIRSEPCVPTSPAVTRVRAASPGAPFPSPVGDAASRPSPGLLRSGFIRSVFLSSSKFLRFSSRSPLVRATLLPGFLPSSRHLRRRPRPRHGFRGPLAGCGRSQPSASFRPQVFATSRRLAPSSVSRACFIPQPRPGFILCAVQGLLPSRSGFQLVAGPCPRAVVPRALTGDPAATCAALDFGASFCGAMRSSGSAINLPLRRSPLRLPPPAGPRFTTVNPVPRAIRS